MHCHADSFSIPSFTHHQLILFRYAFLPKTTISSAAYDQYILRLPALACCYILLLRPQLSKAGPRTCAASSLSRHPGPDPQYGTDCLNLLALAVPLFPHPLLLNLHFPLLGTPSSRRPPYQPTALLHYTHFTHYILYHFTRTSLPRKPFLLRLALRVRLVAAHWHYTKTIDCASLGAHLGKRIWKPHCFSPADPRSPPLPFDFESLLPFFHLRQTLLLTFDFCIFHLHSSYIGRRFVRCLVLFRNSKQSCDFFIPFPQDRWLAGPTINFPSIRASNL